MLGILWFADQPNCPDINAGLNLDSSFPDINLCSQPSQGQQMAIWSLVTLLLSHPQPHAVQVGKPLS
jgi:hypothetical protein